MLVIKRLTIWMAETIFVLFFLGLGWLLFVGYDKTRGIGKDLLLSVTWIGIFSLSTGYLLTTAVSRSIWKDSRPWSYPIIATALFLIHSQICFMTFNSLSEGQRVAFQIPGAITVFTCTTAGGIVLRRWMLGRSSKI